jgi:hypothetical protein
MKSEYVGVFLKNSDTINLGIELDEVSIDNQKENIDDKFYFDFIITIKNGGFFLKRSLQLYSFVRVRDFFNIEYINLLLQEAFGELFNNLWAFAQDAFGNQFAFDLSSKQIVFFNCETGEKEVLASNFEQWLGILFNDFEYLTGMPYIEAWQEKKHLLLPNQRLVPIKPFVIGGEYVVTNFSVLDFPEYFFYNAHIAKQIVNAKDGTKIKLNIKYRR